MLAIVLIADLILSIQPSPELRKHTTGWQSYLLPSVPDLLFLGLLFLLSCSAITPRLLSDAGTGWHIRNGEIILRTHAVTRVDPFSSSMNGQPWFAWEWLYDAGIAAIHHAMGLNGVVLLTAIVVAFTFALVLRFVLARGGDLFLSVILVILAFGASFIHLLARPHVFSWLFTVLWFQILDSSETGDSRSNQRLFWLPVMTVVWVNLHGGFLAGFVLLGIYFFSACAHWVLSTNVRPALQKRIRSLGLVGTLSLVGTFVNPYGYRLHEHIYHYLSNRYLMDHIEEFRSADFHDAGARCFVILVLISCATLALARERTRLSRVLVVVFATGSGFYAARNLPVSAILLMLIVAPVLSSILAQAKTSPAMAGGLKSLLSRWNLFASRMKATEGSLRGHLWPAAGIIVGLWVCLHSGQLGSRQIMDAHFPEKRFPVGAIDFLAQHGMHEPVFCPDYWGGYLIYRLYPETKVVLDDRHDFYGEENIKRYLMIIHAEAGWNKVITERKIQTILVPHESGVASLLRESSQWTLTYEDGVASLFTSRSSPK